MVMSDSENKTQHTQHAFLVAWGWFGDHLGLPERFEALQLKQKRYHHKPQTKVLEFLVSILGGLEHLQDISLAAHPLDKDQAVAEAWGQPGWADYSGVSRTLSSLSWEEAGQIVGILDEISQKYIAAELHLIRSQGQRLQLDGDLTGLPVSNTSRTYPNASFGHMDDEIRLGYQAAVVSLGSPTYGRLWLSVAHHPGDTVSCTQAEALVLAAEARTGLRPWRRTDLLQQRIQACEQQMAETKKRLETQERALQRAKERLCAAEELGQQRKAELVDQEKMYQEKQRMERPTSLLAQSRKRSQAASQRVSSRQKVCKAAQKRLEKTTARRKQQMDELTAMDQRLQRFGQENAANTQPVEADFRLDAGFGIYENIALLIEMGYEVYTKPHGNQALAYLKKQVNDQTVWTRVGGNAELVAWPALPLKKCPYPLDVALERFYTGKTLKHSALFHFGADPVTQDLPAWFRKYNGRQTIEAGIKESKQVFYLHHIKVRSEPAIYLQECFVLFAANFIRWASHWLAEQSHPAKNALDVRRLGVKRQVHVAAHVSAQVIRNSEGRMLRFSKQSAFAGQVLKVVIDTKSGLQKVKF
jgi:galactokinase